MYRYMYFLRVGLKAAPGEWKRWPRHLLDPYHTTAHSKERPLSSARGTRAALTDKDGEL